MKVAVETSYLTIGKGGVARYIQQLIGAFERLHLADIEIFPFCFPFDNFEYRQPRRMIKTAMREFIWQPFIAPMRIRECGADILHNTFSPRIGVPRGVGTVSTIYDMGYHINPYRFRTWTRIRGRYDMQGFQHSDAVISISQSTADDAIRLLGLDARRVYVIHLAGSFCADSSERPVDPPMPEAFFLFVSSLETGKNLRLLKDVYLLAESRGQPLPPLLIVGKRVEGVAGEGLPPANWRYLGRIDDPELVFLYRRAEALVYPSRYEGFGLPVLEGMSLGCPVVCSPLSSIPEVGGDAVYYADQNAESYLAALRLVLRERNLRNEKIQSGLSRAKVFSWEKCARETADVYRTVLNR
ncbi:MAG: glycosyltransferase family 1 protein [Terrimicrobiaceae bacterium]|nr:glycosyltransferase family 1 protein [Terrimicrobiaceae bacterium]